MGKVMLCNNELNSWLRNIADHISITDLCIPGSHDAMTATCHDDYHKTQTLSLIEQLNIGVRFLDLRLTRNLVAAHREWISDISATCIFEELISFLKKNPSEFIILRIQNANEKKDDFPLYKLALQKFIQEYFSAIYFPLDNINEKDNLRYWPTVGEVRGKVVVLECSDPKLNVAINDSQRWAHNWHDNQNIRLQDNWNGPDVHEKIKDIKNMLSKEKGDDRLFLNHISATNGELKKPIHYANIINPITFDLLTDIVDSKKNNPELLNGLPEYNARGVLIYDFIDESICYKAILANQ